MTINPENIHNKGPLETAKKQRSLETETVPVDSLTFDPSNVRKHSERNIDAVRASLNRFGQQKPIVVNSDGVVIAGNGTLAAAKSLGWSEIQVVRTSLTGTDAIAFAIADNRTAELAEWDEGDLARALASLQNDEEFDHLVAGFTDDEIAKLVDGVTGMDLADGDEGSCYTRKIEAPGYEKTGECPAISDLTDKSKSASLETEIKAAGIQKDVEAFLLDAAARHTVFNFEKIAEFYCHADAKVQDLMERSACVIIDFDKAIENGYVRLGEELARLYKQEYGEGDDE
jgi:hypothetical protein